jgi:hypothetical protein
MSYEVLVQGTFELGTSRRFSGWTTQWWRDKWCSENTILILLLPYNWHLFHASFESFVKPIRFTWHNQLIPRSTVLLVKLILCTNSQEIFPPRLWNPKVYKSLTQAPILSQMNPVNTLQPHFPKIHNVFSHLHPDVTSVYFPSGFPAKIFYAFHISLCKLHPPPPPPCHHPWLVISIYSISESANPNDYTVLGALNTGAWVLAYLDA